MHVLTLKLRHLRVVFEVRVRCEFVCEFALGSERAPSLQPAPADLSCLGTRLAAVEGTAKVSAERTTSLEAELSASRAKVEKLEAAGRAASLRERTLASQLAQCAAGS